MRSMMNQRRASSGRGLVAVVVLGLLAQGCASTYWRLGFKDEFEGVQLVDGERVPIPMEPYPYFRGTLTDAIFVAAAFRDVLVRDEHADLLASFIVAPLALVDLPLSGVLDTVLLPRDYVAHRRYAQAMAAHRLRVEELERRLSREGVHGAP